MLRRLEERVVAKRSSLAAAVSRTGMGAGETERMLRAVEVEIALVVQRHNAMMVVAREPRHVKGGTEEKVTLARRRMIGWQVRVKKQVEEGKQWRASTQRGEALERADDECGVSLRIEDGGWRRRRWL